MIVGIHQPHLLPWLGYFNKVLRSDVFIWLHSVQYRKNYYQNRTRIKNINEQPLWLTLPVHASFGMLIDEVTIAEPRWRDKIQKTVEQCYRKAPYFKNCWPPLVEAMAESSDQLHDANYRLFVAVLMLLGAGSIRIEQAGSIGGDSEDPTLRLVNLCRTVGATTYIAGKGGHNYLRTSEFESANIRVIWQEFDPARTVYPQLGATFVPGLSVIDALFNLGGERTREVILSAWEPS
jgi:hypothetical protein